MKILTLKFDFVVPLGLLHKWSHQYWLKNPCLVHPVLGTRDGDPLLCWPWPLGRPHACSRQMSNWDWLPEESLVFGSWSSLGPANGVSKIIFFQTENKIILLTPLADYSCFSTEVTWNNLSQELFFPDLLMSAFPSRSKIQRRIGK